LAFIFDFGPIVQQRRSTRCDLEDLFFVAIQAADPMAAELRFFNSLKGVMPPLDLGRITPPHRVFS
jgi:hypothetical protein